MASIPETTQWETGVYQFETTDPIQGGVGGIDNQPHTQLGNRTKFLKARQDAVAAQAGLSTSDSDQQQCVSAVVLHVPTSISLRAVPIPQIANSRSSIVISRGGAAEGDGLGGIYRWVYNSAAVDDGFNVLRPASAPATGRWLLWIANPAGINASSLNGQAAAFYQNANNLNAGTVPSGRLGTGTADATTYLRGDRVFSTVNAVTLNGQAAAFYQNAANMNAGVLAPARMGAGSPSSGNYLRGDGVWSVVDASTLSGQSGGYYLNASNLNAGTVAPARMGSGTANGATYLRGDNVWSAVNAALLQGWAVSDLTNASNLGAGIVPNGRVSASSIAQHFGLNTAATGSCRLPNGVIFNWGTSAPIGGGGNSFQTFDTPYTAICFGVWITSTNGGGSSQAHDWVQPGTTGFTLRNAASATCVYCWLSLGF